MIKMGLINTLMLLWITAGFWVLLSALLVLSIIMLGNKLNALEKKYYKAIKAINILKKKNTYLNQKQSEIAEKVNEYESAENLYVASLEAPDQTPEPEPEPVIDPVVELVHFYNKGRTNDESRLDFMVRYPRKRLSVTNFMDRKNNPRNPPQPVFEEDTAGIYLALNHDDIYYVVPNFGLKLIDMHYSINAMGEVFECRGYNTGDESQFTLVQPAVFHHMNDTWTLTKQGILQV